MMAEEWAQAWKSGPSGPRPSSGLMDINGLPDYDEVLQHHQTPSSLIAKIEGKPLLFEPGTKYLHEEHSAYNLLALLVEKKTGMPFAAAVEQLVFRPVGLSGSGVDDDSLDANVKMARGYEPEAMYGLKPAKAIHWSAKAGNGSAYTTVSDAARWVDALFLRGFLSPASRSLCSILPPGSAMAGSGDRTSGLVKLLTT